MSISLQLQNSIGTEERMAFETEFDPLSELRRIRLRLNEELGHPPEKEETIEQRDVQIESGPPSSAVRRIEPLPAYDLPKLLPASPLFASLTQETSPLGGPLGESLHALLVSIQSDAPSPEVLPVSHLAVTQEAMMQEAVLRKTVTQTGDLGQRLPPEEPDSRPGIPVDMAAPSDQEDAYGESTVDSDTPGIEASSGNSLPVFQHLAALARLLGWMFLTIGLGLILYDTIFGNLLFWTVGVRIACAGAATILVRRIGDSLFN